MRHNRTEEEEEINDCIEQIKSTMLILLVSSYTNVNSTANPSRYYVDSKHTHSKNKYKQSTNLV